MQRALLTLTIATLWLLSFSGKQDETSFASYKAEFIKGYLQLDVPEVEYDYRDYFN